MSKRHHAGMSVTLSCEQRSVTGSRNLVTYHNLYGDNETIMIDCGAFQGVEENETWNDRITVIQDCSRLNAILLTHSHSDHVGALVVAYKQGFRGPIYCTLQTALATKLILENIYKISKIRWKKSSMPAVYNYDDIVATLDLIKIVEPYKQISITESAKVIFWTNAHLPGSAGIHLCINNAQNFFYTGDFKKASTFWKTRKLPKYLTKRPTTIVTESTYGDLVTKNEPTPCLEANIQKAMQKEMVMVIFAISQGRTEEVLYMLKRMQDQEKLDRNIPIFLDSKLSHKFYHLWNTDDFCKRQFTPANLQMVEGPNHRAQLFQMYPKDGPAIFITASGMGSFGPAPEYIVEFLPNCHAFLQFTSYLPAGTAGRALMDAKNTNKIVFELLGRFVETPKCIIDFTSEISGHSRADELFEEQIMPFEHVEHVLVTHGGLSNRKAFTEFALKEYHKAEAEAIKAGTKPPFIPDFINYNNENIFRIYPEGRIKVIKK